LLEVGMSEHPLSRAIAPASEHGRGVEGSSFVDPFLRGNEI
jgi:hypothetical protein